MALGRSWVPLPSTVTAQAGFSQKRQVLAQLGTKIKKTSRKAPGAVSFHMTHSSPSQTTQLLQFVPRNFTPHAQEQRGFVCPNPWTPRAGGFDVLLTDMLALLC